MAFGIPVIASPVPSYLEIIRHGENGFIARTAREWSKFLMFLRDNPQERVRLGRQAREDVLTGYSKERQCDQYQRVFQELLRERQ